MVPVDRGEEGAGPFFFPACLPSCAICLWGSLSLHLPCPSVQVSRPPVLLPSPSLLHIPVTDVVAGAITGLASPQQSAGMLTCLQQPLFSAASRPP